MSSETCLVLAVVTILRDIHFVRRMRRYATVLASRLLRFPFFAAYAYRSDRVTSSFRVCSFTDRTQGVSLWLPFQTAAGTVTSLYKGACSSLVYLVNNASKINLHFLSFSLSLLGSLPVHVNVSLFLRWSFLRRVFPFPCTSPPLFGHLFVQPSLTRTHG